MYNLETRCFRKQDLTDVKKAFDDELGLDYEETEVDNDYVSFTIFELEYEEISIVRNIENKFKAIDL
jgi:hypothetical protein